MTNSTPIEMVRRDSRRTISALRSLCAGAVVALSILTPVTLTDGVASASTATGLTPAQVHRQQWWITQLDLRRTWRLSEGKDVTVAVLDSGADRAGDKDLAGALVPGFDASGGAGSDDKGFIDTERTQHGSRMADYIAGRGTGFGLLGVARQAKVMPVVVPNSSGITSTVTALTRLSSMAEPPAIVNMSYGAQQACQPELQSAVTRAVRAGMILVAAAGNEGNQGNPDEAPGDCKGVLTVSAIDVRAKVWANSNTAPYVALAAPGVRLVGKDPLAASGYGYAYGTSPSTAIVSGALADVRAKFPNESSRRIVARVLYTARQLQGAAHTRNDNFGYGVVLPSLAMLRTVPANAPNPIFDAVGVTASKPSGDASSTAVSTNPPDGQSSSDRSESPAGGNLGGNVTAPSSGTSVELVVGLVVAILIIVTLLLLLLRSRRRPRDNP